MRYRTLFYAGGAGAVGLLIVATYVSDGSLSFIRAFARAADLPAATINGQIIGFQELYSQAAALEQSAEGTSIDALPYVWNKLRREYALRAIAEDFGITPSRAELNLYVDRYVMTTFGTNAHAGKLIAPLSLWRFKKSIAEPLVLEQLIAKQVILTRQNEAYTQIDDLYTQLVADPSQFEPILAKQTENEESVQATDQLIITASELGEADRKLFRGIQPGSVSPIIATYDGYRIYKVLNYFSEPEEAWQVLELFVPVSIESTIREYIEDQTIVRYAKALL